jgi:outer membrane biosynthesis protein TonB
LANRRGQSGRQLEKSKLYRNAEPVRSAVERYATRVRVRPMKLGNVFNFILFFLVLLEARVKTQKNGAPKKHGPKNIKKQKQKKKKKEQRKKDTRKKRKKEKKGKKEKGKRKERKECLCFSKSSRNKLQHRRVRLVPFALQPRLDPPRHRRA